MRLTATDTTTDKKGFTKQVSFDEQVRLCREYFYNNTTHSKKWNMEYTSYGLKHIVERYYHTYISNDALIEAGKAIFESKKVTSNNYRFKLKLKNNVQ